MPGNDCFEDNSSININLNVGAISLQPIQPPIDRGKTAGQKLTETSDHARLRPGLFSPVHPIVRSSRFDTSEFENVKSASKLEIQISREESLGIAHQDYRGLFDDAACI